MSGPGIVETSFNANNFVEMLRRKYEAGAEKFEISLEDRAACTGALGEVIPDRFDTIGLCLASGYHSGLFSFAFCDAVVTMLVSNVYSDAVAQRDTWPPIFWEAFLAFDAGEFYPPGEKHIDPSEKYTRPLVAALLQKHAVER
jgi:hypothetical protein